MQERKAERALEALRDLSSPRALVVRDGAPRRIAGAEVVRGDLLILAEGDRVPADARLLAATSWRADESLLTGESLPVGKRAGDAVFSGTLVVKGQGRAEVLATGRAHRARPHRRLARGAAAGEDLARARDRAHREAGRGRRPRAVGGDDARALLCCAATGSPACSPGLTLAMAIVPEEFPVVLTVFLALGAWRISRHGVLTRRMPAIEMLGAATVLCVDKTGTLTENRMAVRRTRRRRVVDAAALACELDALDPMDRAIVAARRARRPRACGRQWRLERDYPLTDGFLACATPGARPAAARCASRSRARPRPCCALCGLADGSAQHVEQAAARGLRLLGVAEAEWRGRRRSTIRRAIRSAGSASSRSPIRCAPRCPTRWRCAAAPASAW